MAKLFAVESDCRKNEVTDDVTDEITLKLISVHSTGIHTSMTATATLTFGTIATLKTN